MMYDNHYIVKVYFSNPNDDCIFSVNAQNRTLAISNAIKDLTPHAKDTIKRVDINEQYNAVLEIT